MFHFNNKLEWCHSFCPHPPNCSEGLIICAVGSSEIPSGDLDNGSCIVVSHVLKKLYLLSFNENGYIFDENKLLVQVLKLMHQQRVCVQQKCHRYEDIYFDFSFISIEVNDAEILQYVVYSKVEAAL